MARSIEQIQSAIIADIQATPELAEANSTSRRAIWRLFAYVQASAILLLEQIIDVFTLENDNKISKAIPATASWLNAKVLEFQYSATNPQIVELVNFAPVYPVIDASLRLISRCSVVTTISNQVIIKVAKNEPPVALTTTELNSLQSYVNNIGIIGVNYNCQSSNADKIYIDAEIYYDGQYSTVIQGTVINAINVFLSTLSFNGTLKISDIEIVIRNVVGVNDVLIKNLKTRSDATAFVDGTFLIQNNTVISRIFPTVSGYIVQETTAGQTFADKLTFIAI
jgi:hypothetical protein